jgi:hypothetical protein
MPVYSFRCRSCNRYELLTSPIHTPPEPHPCGCQFDGMMKRDYQADKPQPAPVWQEHWNPSVGGYVSDRRKMQDSMDRYNDNLFERTGIEQKNVVVDRADMDSLKLPNEVQ